MSEGILNEYETEAPVVSATGEILPAYYDVARKVFWIENLRGGWVSVTEGSMKRHLQKRGFSGQRVGGDLSAADARLADIQVENDVAYAGPLAGRLRGPMEMCGNRILVTTSPKLIHPVVGSWPILKQFLQNLLGSDQREQLPYLYGWLKCGYESLRSGIPKHGQAMTIAGEKDCGKSLLQKLFTEILGGRAAKPYRYMTGGTDFNSDLFGSEHLMIEDEAASTDMRARKAFASKIKSFTVNTLQSCHGKGQQALSLEPFWRLSITLNDTPEDLMVLPPIDESISDKVILLKARRAPMPMLTGTPDQQRAFWGTMISELPAFLAHLIDWTIPESLRCERFGVRAFQHPELLAALSELASETRLLRLIDEVIFASGAGSTSFSNTPKIGAELQPWIGTAESLENALLHSEFSHEARKLLHWSNATGTFLGRLAKEHPERVQDKRTADTRRWQILPPKKQ